MGKSITSIILMFAYFGAWSQVGTQRLNRIEQSPTPEMGLLTDQNSILEYVDANAFLAWLGLSGGATDDQKITSFSYDQITNILTIEVEDGDGPKTVDLSQLAEDNQSIISLTVSAQGILSIQLEDGGPPKTLDLSQFTQQISIVNRTIFLSGNGGSINLPPDEVGTDNQVLTITFNPTTKVLSFSLEDGGSGSFSLSTLEEDLQLIGNTLSIINGSNPIDLTPYLDNTDNQQITSFDFNAGVLTITLEDGGSRTVTIVETDPVFDAHVSSSITQTDIDNWNNDEVIDSDADPENEKDTVIVSQTLPYNLILDGAVKQASGEAGPIEIIWEIDSSITVIAYDGGSSNLSATFNPETSVLLFSNGNDVDLSLLKNSTVERVEIKNSTASSIVSSIDLFATGRRECFLNGTMMTETPTRSHPNHITISSNTITLYESLETSDILVIRSLGE